MKIKLNGFKRKRCQKEKRADNFSGQASKNGACPLALLSCSLAFGIYKNFTAIDQHTTHVKWL